MNLNVRRAAQRLGQLGGLVRARRLSVKQKRAIATLGGHGRARSLRCMRHITENFRYVATICALKKPPRTISTSRCTTPLPNAHAKRRLTLS